jgi:S-adenosylmethionine uptake transporter
MNRPHLVFLRNATGIVGSFFGVYAFTTLPLAEAYSLLFLVPAFVTILSIPMLGEQVGWRRWLAVLVGFVGVLVVVRPGFREVHLGHLSAVVAAAFGAVSLITIRKIGRTENRITLLTMLYLSALVVDGALMMIDFKVPTWTEVAIFTVGGFMGGVGQIGMVIAMRLAPSNRVAPTQYSQIVWAIVYGAILFGDFPDPVAFIGIALVIASGLFTLFREEQLYGWSRRAFFMRNRQ